MELKIFRKGVSTLIMIVLRLTPQFAPLLYCHSARVVYGVRFKLA